VSRLTPESVSSTNTAPATAPDAITAKNAIITITARLASIERRLPRRSRLRRLRRL
jgi:hypothetical protein